MNTLANQNEATKSKVPNIGCLTKMLITSTQSCRVLGE